ncbi:MAG: hypothetical protein WCR06_10130 [bacterium]
MLLWFLALVYLFGCINTWKSASELINSLRPLRLSLFVTCALLLGVAGQALLKQRAWGRMLVLASLALHFGYIVYYNGLDLYANDPPSLLEWFGLAVCMGMILVSFAAIGVWPFTPAFSRYLRKQGEYAGKGRSAPPPPLPASSCSHYGAKTPYGVTTNDLETAKKPFVVCP